MPFLPVLDRSGHTAVSALEAAKQVAREALSDGPLDIGGLSGALTAGLPTLSPMCRGRCRVEHIDQGLFDLVGGSGLWRKERHDGVSVYIAMEEPTDADGTRRQLVRRYLHCSGPSTPAHFAEWCGISTADAARSLASPDTVEVDGHRFVLTDDIERLTSAPPATGIRLLPPRDPYLLDRDRTALVPDREWQRKIWRATPTEGLVLIDGVPAAMWRPKKSRDHLTLRVEPFDALTATEVEELNEDATLIAAHRGCTSVDVTIT